MRLRVTSWASKSFITTWINKQMSVSCRSSCFYRKTPPGSATCGCEFGDSNLSSGHFKSLITSTYFGLVWSRLLTVQWFCSHPQKYTGYNNVLFFFKQKQKQKVKWGYWISAVPQGVGRITMCCAARCLTTAVRWGVGQTSTCAVSVTCKDGDLHLFCFWSETAVRAYSSYSSFSLCSIQVTLNTLWGRPKQFT